MAWPTEQKQKCFFEFTIKDLGPLNQAEFMKWTYLAGNKIRLIEYIGATDRIPMELTGSDNYPYLIMMFQPNVYTRVAGEIVRNPGSLHTT